MARKWAGRWAGGRYFVDARGRRVYVLERQVGGERRALSLGAISERQALAELALFERNPEGYQSPAVARVRAEALTITRERVEDWLAYLRSEDRTKKYRKDSRRYLGVWATTLHDLGTPDLRTVTVLELRAALAQMPGAQLQRIAALKSFASWLREQKGAFGSARDATLDLAVPQAKPEKAKRAKGYSVRHVEQLYRHIADQSVRDLIALRAKTGMHHTEIDRLARGLGDVEQVDGAGEIAGTIAFPHKRGERHVVSVDAQCLAAARRLQARGVAPSEGFVARSIADAVQDAAASRIALKPISEGELRHSFATWAATAGREVRPGTGGLPLAAVAAALGHRSPRTTQRFYDGTVVPPMVVVPVSLVHPDDPEPIAKRKRVTQRRSP